MHICFGMTPLQFFTSYANLDEMINIILLAHQIGLGTARQWLLDPTVDYEGYDIFELWTLSGKLYLLC